MNLEVVRKDNSKSKLTIAKDRCTIKIAPTDEELEDRIIQMSEQILETISPVEVTHRGQFYLVDGVLEIRLSKYTVNKEHTSKFIEGNIQ